MVANIPVHKHPLLRDQWPPDPGGAFNKSYVAPLDGLDVLEQVYYYAPVGDEKANVALLTRYGGHQHTRDILLSDPAFASKLASWLRQHIGKTIQQIGNLEINF